LATKDRHALIGWESASTCPGALSPALALMLTTSVTAARRPAITGPADQQKRKPLVWDIDKKLQEDVARPIIFHNRGGTCSQPRLKGLRLMVNSIYNGYRFEDIWLDK
jgi:hypothetical protein